MEDSTIQIDKGNDNPNIIVAVRCRPETEEEKAMYRPIIKILDENVVIFDPVDMNQIVPRGVPNHSNRRKDCKFAFDRVFDQYAPQHEIYEHTTKRLIQDVLAGYNCTCFAYGATGAGKTFTMIGNPQHPGIMVLTMRDLFHAIADNKSERQYHLSVSYMEIYNETIRDLLVENSKPLALREDGDKGTCTISGLSSQVPTSVEEVMELLAIGNARRSQHPTDANKESSRSHAVFQITIRQTDRTANIAADVKVGKLSLIDLAGSERAARTKNQGIRLVEGANINKSLLALGNCINALGQGYKEGKYVPYRNSKLTRLLKDSLSGNSKTVMIAAISPSSLTYEDTFNTLTYSNRAKNIKTKVTRNVLNVKFHVGQYRDIINELRNEIRELKSKIQIYEAQGVAPVSAIDKEKEKNAADQLREEIQNYVNERTSVQKALEELAQKEERKVAQHQAKIAEVANWERETRLEAAALHQFNAHNSISSRTINSTPTRIKQLKSEIASFDPLEIENEKNSLIKRLQTNADRTKQIFDEMPRRVKSQSNREQITHDVTVHWLELEKLNKDIELKAKDQAIKQLEQQNKDLLELVSFQMRALQERDAVPVEMLAKFGHMFESPSRNKTAELKPRTMSPQTTVKSPTRTIQLGQPITPAYSFQSMLKQAVEPQQESTPQRKRSPHHGHKKPSPHRQGRGRSPRNSPQNGGRSNTNKEFNSPIRDITNNVPQTPQSIGKSPGRRMTLAAMPRTEAAPKAVKQVTFESRLPPPRVRVTKPADHADSANSANPAAPPSLKTGLRFAKAARSAYSFRSKVNKSDRNIQTLGNVGDLVGHRGCVNVISFNTTGSLLVSGSDDGTVKIWNVQTRKCLQTLTGHISNVFAGDFLPHKADRDIISGGNDADVRHYNLERSECTVYQHHAKKILRLSVCPSMPDCFLTASADGTVRLFDVRQKYSDTKTHSFSSDDNSAPEEMVLPQAFGGGRASRWEGHPRNTASLVLDWRRDSSFTRHNRNVGVVLYSVDFNPSQGQQFIVGSSQGNVQLFDLRKIDDCSPSKSYLNIYRNFELDEPSHREVTGCVFSKDGSEIASTALSEQIYTFDTNKNYEELYDLDYSATLEERKAMLQKASSNLMDTESTNPEPIPKIDKTLSTGLSQSEIQMASLAAYLVSHNYLSVQEAVNLNVHSPNSPTAPGGNTTQNQEFNSAPKVMPVLKTYKRMFQGHYSASTIKGVNFYGPNSEYVMSGSDDAKVFIWDKATGELVQVLEGHKSIVNCIIGHPNVPMIASSGIDTEIKLWGPMGDYPNDDLLAKRKHRRDRIKQLNIEAYQNQVMYGSDEDDGGGQVNCQQQ